MTRRIPPPVVLLALLLGLPGVARAEPSPAGKALIAAGLTAAGEAVGAGVTGLAGTGIGAATCTQTFECYAPFFLGISGAALGGVGGGMGGAVGGAYAAHAPPGRVALGAAAGGLVGFGIFAAGVIRGEEELVTAGAVTGALAMPLGAGIMAGTGRSRAQGPALLVSPAFGREYQGVSITLIR